MAVDYSDANQAPVPDPNARPIATFSGTGQALPPGYQRPTATFTAAANQPRMPRMATSAMDGASFSAAELPVNAQFAQANEHSVALRAMGRGPNEMAGMHQLSTPMGSSQMSTGELLDVVTGGRASAARAASQQAPIFSGGGNGSGTRFNNGGSGPAQEAEK